MAVKECVVCGVAFDGRKKTCSIDCAKSWSADREKARYQKNKEAMLARRHENYRVNRGRELLRADEYYNAKKDEILDRQKRHSLDMTAANKTVKLLSVYGIASLSDGFSEPKRVLSERARDRKRYANGKRSRIPSLDITRASNAKRRAALQFVREIQSKGIGALL